jgi:hypothetical protein
MLTAISEIRAIRDLTLLRNKKYARIRSGSIRVILNFILTAISEISAIRDLIRDFIRDSYSPR